MGVRAPLLVALTLLLGVADVADAQNTPATPSWHPPAPIVPTSGAGRAILPMRAPARPAPPDHRLRDSNLALGLGFLIVPPVNSSFDDTLSERSISPELGWGMDLRLVHRAWKWLWIGGATGFRRRAYNSPGPEVNAHGVDLRLALEGRFPIGSNFELTPHLGAGASYAAVSYNNVTEGGIAPRVSFGLAAGLWFAGDSRFVMRLDYDYYPTAYVNAEKQFVNLGGIGVYFGVEWRPSAGEES